MLPRADIRFLSSGRDAVTTPSFALPLHLVIDRPTAESGLTEARRLADALRAELSGADAPGGRVELIDPAIRSHASLEQRSRGEVRLELTLWLSVTPPPGEDFWVRTHAIGRATDLAQRFAQRPHGKGVEVDAGRVEAVPPPAPQKPVGPPQAGESPPPQAQP